MIDLKKKKTQGAPVLHSYSAKGDGTDTQGVIFDLKLRMPVPDQGAADVVNDYIPGASSGFRAFESGDERGYEHKGKADGLSLRIGVFDAASGNPGSPDHEGTGEVREAKMVTGKGGAWYHLVLRLYGFDPSAAGYFLERSRKLDAIGLILEPVQPGLNFGNTASTVGIATLQTKPGDDDSIHFGEVLEEGSKISVDDFGITIQVSDPSLIISRIEVSTENGDVRDLISRYANRCADASLSPSWEYLLQALAAVCGMMPPGGRYMLNAAIVDAAYTATLDALGGDEPPVDPAPEAASEPDEEPSGSGAQPSAGSPFEKAGVKPAEHPTSAYPEPDADPTEDQAVSEPAPFEQNGLPSEQMGSSINRVPSPAAGSGVLTEAAMITALQKAAGNVSAAAVILDVDRSKLRRALKKIAINPADYR